MVNTQFFMRGRVGFELAGKRFGRVVVTAKQGPSPSGYVWVYRCDCGTEKTATASSLVNGDVKSCGCLRREASRSRRGDKSPSWKGGYKNKKGYVVITENGISKFQHRIVMEQKLGRNLFVDENVHHKNGVRNDNRIENLELWSTSQPSGQRVEDKTKWAIDWLKKYRPEVLR